MKRRNWKILEVSMQPSKIAQRLEAERIRASHMSRHVAGLQVRTCVRYLRAFGSTTAVYMVVAREEM